MDKKSIFKIGDKNFIFVFEGKNHLKKNKGTRRALCIDAGKQ